MKKAANADKKRGLRLKEILCETFGEDVSEREKARMVGVTSPALRHSLSGGNINNAVLAELAREGVDVPAPAPPQQLWDPETPDGAWHEAAFQQSPVYIQQAVGRTGRTELLPQEAGRGSYHLAGRIHMERELSDKSDPHAAGVWRHEFGHAIDYRTRDNRWQWSDEHLLDPMEQDAKNMIRASALGRKSKAKTARAEALHRSYRKQLGHLRMADPDDADAWLAGRARDLGLDFDRLDGLLRKHTELHRYRTADGVWRTTNADDLRESVCNVLTALEEGDAQGLLEALEHADHTQSGWRRGPERRATFYKGSEGALSDLFSAATRKKVEGSGSHPASYYRDRGKAGQTREAVANLTELLGDEYADQWAVILGRTVPRMTAAWREHLQRIADGGIL